MGAGGFARETAQLVHAINDQHPTWELLGYLDDDKTKRGSTIDGAVVLGTTAELERFNAPAVVVCVGSPRNYAARMRIVERLGLPADRYATLVHPLAAISRSSTVGPGSVIHAGCVLTAAVAVGAHVALMPQVVLTHDDRVGDYATFGAGVRLAGGVCVGEGAYVGSATAVREELSIGDWSLVGMGSVVTRAVPCGEVWAGVPARFVRMADPAGTRQEQDGARPTPVRPSADSRVGLTL
ncbi:MAG: NeuD/PglB/VioB family sugar acetyltransferase [Acidimicrobiales bacterium]